MDNNHHLQREIPLILVAEDDVATRLLLRHALEKESYEVIDAEDGNEAIDLFISADPDMVVLDVMMPGLDGIAACKHIRGLNGGANLPILMLTSLDDIDTIDTAFQAGATDFITKPINWSLIRQRINQALRSHRNHMDLRTSQMRLNNALQVASLGHWDWDITANELNWSDHVNTILGLDQAPEGYSFNSFLKLVHLEDREIVLHAVERAIRTGETYSCDHRIIRQDGEERILHEHAEVILDAHDMPVRMIGIVQDITEHVRAEETIKRHIYYDEMTGLPNRRLFIERLQKACENASKHKQIFAVILIDVDRLKMVNDTHGYATGDRLLKTIGRRLQETLDSDNTVALLGSDEFAILIDNPGNTDSINTTCIELQKTISQKCVIDGEDFYITASMGITVYPEDDSGDKSLLLHAESAMYAAKENGGNRFCFYNRDINTRAQQRLQIDMALHEAIGNNELEVYYQPQIDVETGSIIGMEALTRWNSSKLGAVSPLDYIPAAENNGLIIPLGEWVLRKACEQAAKWHREGHTGLRMGVNLSPRQFLNEALPRDVEAILDETGLDPCCLELEITESCTFSDYEASISILQRLKELKVRVSIDDFGTGYSSLSYLHKLPIDTIKIDRAFVSCIGKNGENGTIARTIIALAHSLGLGVIAEGIEEPHHLEFLRQEGCNEAQGFLVSRPVSAGEIEQLLYLPSRTVFAAAR